MWWKVSVIVFLLVLPLVGTRGAGKEVKVPGQPKHIEYENQIMQLSKKRGSYHS